MISCGGFPCCRRKSQERTYHTGLSNAYRDASMFLFDCLSPLDGVEWVALDPKPYVSKNEGLLHSIRYEYMYIYIYIEEWV